MVGHGTGECIRNSRERNFHNNYVSEIKIGGRMFRRITKSFNIAVHVAIVGFEKSYKGETVDSILGYTDSLTKIPNRKAFERDKGKFGGRYSLVLLDIDNFKRINDTRGHLFGDRILKRLANILKEAVVPGGKVYRIAGDEFALIAPRNKVKSICVAIRKNVRREDSITISQGVVLNLENGITDKSLKEADTAMYQSKTNGKGKITVSIPAVA